MFIDQSNLIANAEIFDADSENNFVDTLAEFTDVITIFPDLKSKSDAFKKVYTFGGFIFKGIEYKEKYDHFALAATFTLGSMLKSKDNYRYHKRIILSEKQGRQLRDALNFDRDHHSNLKRLNTFFKEKHLHESDHTVTAEFDNILEEENNFVTTTIHFRIISSIEHSRIINMRNNNVSEIDAKNLQLQETQCSNKYPNNKCPDEQTKLFDSVCVYFHGGGQIAGGNFHHQIYTNQIAKYFPVISLDQRLAPEQPYPAAINDAFRMFEQINSGQIEKELGYTPKQIILSGDSAGGNLACVLMQLLIEHRKNNNVKGMILTWPAMNLNSYRLNKFYMYLFGSRTLNFNAINQMQKCQCNSDAREDNSDQFKANQTCPIELNDEILKEWPPSQAILGSEDSLSLDSMYLFSRLHNLHRIVKLHVMLGMPHAFLQFSTIIDEIKIGFDQLMKGCEFIKENIYENEQHDIEQLMDKRKLTNKKISI